MAKQEVPPDELAQALEEGREMFEKEALAAMAAPILCNNFYVQPFPGINTIGLCVGGLQVLPDSNGRQTPSAQIVEAVYISRDVAINLAAYLQHFCNATPDEIATAKSVAESSGQHVRKEK